MTGTMTSRYIKILTLGSLLIGGLVAIIQTVGFTILVESTPNKVDSGELSVRLYQEKEGWGYDIVNSGDVFIRQPFVPGISGYQPFQSKNDALKTGRLVLQKVRRGQPPAISVDELDSLDVNIR